MSLSGVEKGQNGDIGDIERAHKCLVSVYGGTQPANASREAVCLGLCPTRRTEPALRVPGALGGTVRQVTRTVGDLGARARAT